MNNAAEKALADLRSFVERSTHWQEGKPDRHDAMLALKALDQYASRVRGAELEMTAALGYVDAVCTHKETEVTYETLQRNGFKRKEGWRRRYTLTDARSDARCAAKRLRNAWQLLDPIE